MESRRKLRRGGRKASLGHQHLTSISENRHNWRSISPPHAPPRIAFLLSDAGVFALEEGDRRITNSTSSSEDIEEEHRASEATNKALVFIQEEAQRVSALVGLFDNGHYM